jgi:very-short-patch-repair endonuclease
VPLDRAAARVAGRQFGVISTAQLAACGLSHNRIGQRVKAGQLQRLWRGVYAFGHRKLTRQGHLIAAVLACGPNAVVSHLAAAVEWELLTFGARAIDVTVPAGGTRAERPGIRLHCTRSLDPDDVTCKDGIPMTTPAKTLIDLDAVVSARLLERAFEQAQIRRLLPAGALEAAIERAHGRRTRILRALIARERRARTVTRSELEERFLALIRCDGLPEPEVNARLAGYEVDFLWRGRRRVIEVDGHAYHSTRQAASRDRRKDDDLEAAGYRVTRFTADQILHDPSDTLERTRRALGPQ